MPHLKTNLLIVDDEPSTLMLMAKIFESLGYRVRTAEDGFAALEQIRAERPDILLSDLNMPRMSGFELLYVVRRNFPSIYVIACSASFEGEEVPRGVAADAFYAKATGLNRLFRLIGLAFREEQPRAGASAAPPIWISPGAGQGASAFSALISCPECLRAFSLPVGTADSLIHEANCKFCGTPIHYATVQPVSPAHPLHFEAERRRRVA